MGPLACTLQTHPAMFVCCCCLCFVFLFCFVVVFLFFVKPIQQCCRTHPPAPPERLRSSICTVAMQCCCYRKNPAGRQCKDDCTKHAAVRTAAWQPRHVGRIAAAVRERSSTEGIKHARRKHAVAECVCCRTPKQLSPRLSPSHHNRAPKPDRSMSLSVMICSRVAGCRDLLATSFTAPTKSSSR